MPTLDIQAAAVRTLAAYFDTALPALDADFLPCVEGWPEWEEERVDTTGPFVSITPVRAGVAWHTPVTHAQSNTSATEALVTYRLADVDLTLQVDLWDPYKERLHERAYLVEQAYHNDLPYSSGLILTATDHLDSRLSVYLAQEVRRVATTMSAKAGEQRKTWVLRAHMDMLVQATSPRQAQITALGTYTIGGVALAEPLLTVS